MPHRIRIDWGALLRETKDKNLNKFFDSNETQKLKEFYTILLCKFDIICSCNYYSTAGHEVGKKSCNSCWKATIEREGNKEKFGGVIYIDQCIV